MQFGTQQCRLDAPRVMGIINITPDSFSDGGHFNTVDRALTHAREMVAEGASFVDVGGESTRPGAAPVSVQEELDRVCPVVEAIASEVETIISVDTSTPEVILETARLGAGLINDVRALRREGALSAAADSGLPVCLMHMQGEPGTMQERPRYDSVTEEVAGFLKARVDAVRAAGIAGDQLILDPGFGFGKSVTHNLQLLGRLERFHELGYPLLVGMSRKSMLGHVTGRSVDERLPASVAAATISALKGAQILRVHDVNATIDAARLVAAMEDAIT
ncbi:dihydropteroate synthase [Tamilnaduibacter salinus]|uniref:Dihydropteroate synthase n=1 Tax=Tamilnaduibacter salinus TaxID=1484056 RepID=A0A2U1CWC5_9GAMM|nr:dihydropteroate synthase [Tamilnaduibacter salinus]PVY75948.1 dihydropteroate synthase [Tamilnaduibacter salinus]